MSSLCALGGGVAISCNAVPKDCGAIGGFWTSCEALYVVANRKPPWSIRSRLFTAVTLSLHPHCEVVIVEFRLKKKLKMKLKDGRGIQGKIKWLKEDDRRQDTKSRDQSVGQHVGMMESRMCIRKTNKKDRFILE